MCVYYNCQFRASNGYCMITACVNPEYNMSGTYKVGKNGFLEKIGNNMGVLDAGTSDGKCQVNHKEKGE